MITFVDLRPEFPTEAMAVVPGGTGVYVGNVEEYQPVGRRVFYLSPANSFGYMDGGIDAVYSIRMFPGLEGVVKKRYKEEGHLTLLGRPYLPIGKAVIVPCPGQRGTPARFYCVSSPTMLQPQNVSKTRNAYYAMLASLRALEEFEFDEQLDELIVPGLCCGYGKISAQESARQIATAVQDYGTIELDLEQIIDEQPNYYENTEFKEIQEIELH